MDWKEHNATRDQLRKELDDDTPRARRAQQFARQVMALVQDFIPRDRECLRLLDETLMIDAFRADVEIVNVPPERDLERKAALRAAEVAMMPTMIIPKAGSI